MQSVPAGLFLEGERSQRTNSLKAGPALACPQVSALKGLFPSVRHWEAAKNTRVKRMGKAEVKFLQLYVLRAHLKQAIKMVMVIGSNDLLVPHLNLFLPEIPTSVTCTPGMSLLSSL